MPEDKSTPNDPLSGLLASIMAGSQIGQGPVPNEGDSLPTGMPGLSQGPNPPQSGESTGGGLGELLGGLMGGASPAGMPTQGAGDNPLGALLGGMLGGASQGGTPDQAAGSDPLGAFLGGQQGSGPAGGMPPPSASGDPMNAVLGMLGGGAQGGTSGTGALGENSFLAPIVDAIASKVGIPPQLAQAIVSFALLQLMGGKGAGLGEMLGGTGKVSQSYLHESGMVDELAQQTGMDPKTAANSLQQVLQAFSTQMGEGTTDDRQRSLQAWLDAK